LQPLDIIKFVVDVQIDLRNVNIIALENYKCSEKYHENNKIRYTLQIFE
jgi:hypothetical protein